MIDEIKPHRRAAILSDRLLARGGGTERYILELIRSLLQRRYDVCVYTTRVSVPPPFLNQTGLQLVCHPLPFCPRKLRAPFFLRTLRRHFRPHGFDMIIGINTPYSPHISVCCGTYLGSMLADRRQLFKPLNWVRVYFERKKYRGCQWLMAHTPMQKQELVRLFDVSEDRIRVLPPPVMQSFAPKNEHSRALSLIHI